MHTHLIVSKPLFVWVLLLAFIADPVNACTVVRFQIGDDYLVARNHDWTFGEGLIIVQPRGLTKKGISTVRPAKWTSRFGSVSFTQFGRGIPFAGMNEAGLTVDLLQLNTASFPIARTLDRDSVNVIQWVQYQLDNSANVDEVIRSLDKVYPVPLFPAIERVHFFLTDASGGVAIVEFIGGKPVIRHGPEPIHCALANTDIQTSAKQHSDHDKTRYGRAARSIADVQSSNTLADASKQAFAVLSDVSQIGLTQWSLLYQPKQRRLTFHTTVNPKDRWIDLSDFDLQEGSPTLAIDVHAPHQGSLRDHFRPIRVEDNARIVNHAFDSYLPPGIGRMAVKQLILNYSTSVKESGIGF
jgi:penicillin V acylase-like amidase (Ntn superfamily)